MHSRPIANVRTRSCYNICADVVPNWSIRCLRVPPHWQVCNWGCRWRYLQHRCHLTCRKSFELLPSIVYCFNFDHGDKRNDFGLTKFGNVAEGAQSKHRRCCIPTKVANLPMRARFSKATVWERYKEREPLSRDRPHETPVTVVWQKAYSISYDSRTKPHTISHTILGTKSRKHLLLHNKR